MEWEKFPEEPSFERRPPILMKMMRSYFGEENEDDEGSCRDDGDGIDESASRHGSRRPSAGKRARMATQMVSIACADNQNSLS